MASINGQPLSFEAVIEDKDFDKHLDQLGRKLNEFGEAQNRAFKQGADGQKEQIKQNELLQKSIMQLQIQMDSYRAIVAKSNDPAVVSKYNAEIEKLEQKIKQISNIGRSGFDAMGRPMKEQLGLLQRLEKAAELYQRGIRNATNEENLRKYNKRLEETNKEIQRMKNAGREGFDDMGNAVNRNSGLMGRLKTNILSIGASLGVVFGVDMIVQFGKQLFDLAKKAEGVELAFARIGSQDQLQQLRKQTRGTVSDLELMQAAVKASNFRIPLDTLGKGLAFAQKRARETGDDVNYLVDSFVTGMGRKSTMILDNLGLSLVEIQEELQKTGDFATAVGNIIDREMGQSAESVDFLADRTDRLSATWENIKRKAGSVLQYLFDPAALDTDKIAELTEKIGENFGDLDRLSVGQLDTAIYRLVEQRKQLDKQRAQIVRDVESGDLSDAAGQVKDTPLKQESMAIDNVLTQMRKQQQYLKLQRREKEGILSITELQAKMEAKRTEALSIIPNSEEAIGNRARLLKEAEDIQKEIDKILGKEKQKKEPKDRYDEAKARQDMLQQIAELEAEYNRKSLSQEEEQQQAIRDRFAKLAYQVKKFNDDPRNKVKIDVSILEPIRNKAIADLTYKQETENLKIELEERKKLFSDFEDYRASFGEGKANQRYEEELKGFKSYMESLQAELNALESVPVDNRDANYDTRRKDIEKRIKQEEDAEQKKYDSLLKSLRTYEAQRLLLTEEYQRQRKQLQLGGDILALEELDKAYASNLNALDDAYAQKMDAFKNLFNGVEQLGTQEARNVVKLAQQKLKELVAAGRISKELQKEIEQMLKGTTKAIDSRMPKQIAEMGAELSKLAYAVEGIDQGFAQVIGTTGNLLQNLAMAQESALNMKEALGKKDIMGSFSAGFGIVQGVMAAINVAKSIGDSMNAKNAAERQRAAEQQQYVFDMQIKQNDAILKQLDRQLSLIREIYGTERITEYQRSLKVIQAEYEKMSTSFYKTKPSLETDGLFALTGTNKELDKALQEYYQGLRSIYSLNPKGNPWTQQELDKLIPLNQMIADLQNPAKKGSALAELQDLMERGLLDSATAALVEGLVALEEQYKDTINAIRAELTGTSIEGLVDELAEMFARGEQSAEAFGEKFEEIMKRSILNSFKRQALEKEMQGFYELFSSYSEDVLDKEEIGKLKEEFDRIITDAKSKFEDLSKITGIGFGDEGATAQNGLAGAIRGISEEQADLLAGQFGAVRLHLAELVGMKRQEMGLDKDNSFLLQTSYSMQEMSRLAFQNLQVVQRIEQGVNSTVLNTAETVNRLADVVRINADQHRSLKSIDSKISNTNDILRANGG